MDIELDQIRRVAWLACLPVDDDALHEYHRHFRRLLEFVGDIQSAPIDGVAPLSNPLEAVQRQRPDVVTESNQREAYQPLSADTDEGLYWVPRVVE